MADDFIELRWFQVAGQQPILRYRIRSPVVDASGAMRGFGEWSEWKEPLLTFRS